MKTLPLRLLVICAFVSICSTHARAEEVAALNSGNNVRLVLEISTQGKPTASFAIVSSGPDVSMDDIADMVEIDGNSAPTIVMFSAKLKPTGESGYVVACSYGLQIPVVTGQSTTNGATCSTFEYRNIGVKSTVNMAIGKKLELLKDPERTLTLELQPTENAKAP